MDSYFNIAVTEEDIKREKRRARELRRSRWWKERIAKGVCEMCGALAQELTMDHIVPLAKGGKTVKNNIAAVCKECNNKKRDDLRW